jgi:hypothetical protein
MEDKNWKTWDKETYRTIKKGRYWLKLKNDEICYDDFKYRGSLGWGFSGYSHSVGIVEYAKF